ncbi:MAG: single-stranded-DNA-specific exonuclease RecJ [Parvularculaceae bacterium]
MTSAQRLDAATYPDPSDAPGDGLQLAGPTASGRPWRFQPADEAVAAAIAARVGGSRALGRVLAGRGVTPDGAAAFVNPMLREAMPDPFTLKDMDAAAARLAQAIAAGEKVGLFGDYDVDGTTAAAIFKLYFEAVGADLAVYLPDRILEGYGPTEAAFEALRGEGASLIVTVDCGAAAAAPIAAMANAGVDVVVIDHHQMAGPPPTGAICVNPHRADDRSGLDMLSAAGLAFMAVVALNRALREKDWFKDRSEPDCRRFLDLAALGLVCDVMPMRGLARAMTAAGLKLMVAGRAANPGLRALADAAGVKGPPSTYHLGFALGPRLNAAGRIGHARLAFDLMTTDDPATRIELAERLHLLNAERQAIERDVQDAAIAEVERRGLAGRAAIVIAGEGWHPGVIGVVAGRLKDRYGRPVVVVALDGETGKGSGRSLDGVDLGAAVARLREAGLLVNGGGHAMAAGLTVARDRLDVFADALEGLVAPAVETARRARALIVEGEMAPGAVTRAFADDIARAGPFGPGAPEPTFLVRDVAVAARRVVGQGHVACDLVAADGSRARAIAFRAANEPRGAARAEDARVHVVGRVKADDWRGGEAGQLHIVDAAPA